MLHNSDQFEQSNAFYIFDKFPVYSTGSFDKQSGLSDYYSLPVQFECDDPEFGTGYYNGHTTQDIDISSKVPPSNKDSLESPFLF